MQRASGSGERTPLVQPSYVFESSLTRSYQKRLRHFQCAICVGLIALLGVALLVTVSYNLSEDLEDASDTAPTSPTPVAVANLTLTAPSLAPLLQLSWPLKGRPPATWAGDPPTPAAINIAVEHGRAALKRRAAMESQRRPLDQDAPALRAQRAAATSASVKPLADDAFVVEQATKALLNGTDSSKREGGAGIGPSTNGSYTEPRYCQSDQQPCPPSKYRSQDGSCNNLRRPYLWGVSNTPFRRVLPPDYGDGISTPRTGVDGAQLPSARDVSVTVHRPSYTHDSSFTVMLAVWGQFIDHDITATALSKGENSSALSCCDPSLPPHPECFPVQLAPEDPFYQEYNVTCMEFVRSAPAPTCYFGPREQMNQATAYLDGSTVYGYSEERATELRTGEGGRLRMLHIGGRDLLPAAPAQDPCNTAAMAAQGRYCFITGDDRANENLHLTTMHLIWARQHNRLATTLQQMNPSWDNEKLYQEARRIVGAQMQHITYTEFLPSVLGWDVMYALNMTVMEEGYSDAYQPGVDASMANHFSAAAFRFAHTLLPGLIHNVDAATGTVNYVQLHNMLFNPYTLYDVRGAKTAVRSAMDTPVHSVDPHVTTELSNHLFERPQPANWSSSPTAQPSQTNQARPCGLDLVSLNIQRGRDHGLPPHARFRSLCGLSAPQEFADLGNIYDQSSLSRISTIYKHVDDIDLYTGALAENPRGRLLGPTLSCLIADQFLRLKIGDRFWYETSDSTVRFTLEQLTEIRKTTLAGVICANEELLDQTQPRAMETVSANNPLVDCRELPQPDLSPWRE
ncbi:hypothetical protein ACJJTC_015461 [Scirpophaga incertulas]